MQETYAALPKSTLTLSSPNKKVKIATKKNAIAFGRYPQKPYLCTAFTKASAAIAQLVEHDLAKVGVASSSLVCRSKIDL